MTGRRPARRADAVRNRTRLLEAGERLMRESRPIGPDSVAREAGVGVGTFYRHFPTVGEFATQLLANDIGQVAESADELLAASPPAEALRQWVTMLADLTVRRQLMSSALRIEVVIGEASPYRLVHALGKILDAGKEAGSMRAEVRTEALMLLVIGAVTTWAKGDYEHSLPPVIDLIVAATRP